MSISKFIKKFNEPDGKNCNFKRELSRNHYKTADGKWYQVAIPKSSTCLINCKPGDLIIFRYGFHTFIFRSLNRT